MFKKVLLNAILFLSCIFFIFKEEKIHFNSDPPTIRVPKTPEIGNYIFGYQDYSEIYKTLKDWESKAEDLIDVGSFGETTKKNKQYYIKISNEHNPGSKKVFITACIHGNEPLSTSTVMAYAGMLISNYGKNKDVTEVLNTTTVYIIPVVSPDTYPSNRHVDGVDPNRNFPTFKEPDKTSVLPIKNLQNFFLEVKPNSVLSGHTYGRIYLIPWGDSTKDNPNINDYIEIAKNMSNLSGYKYQRACEMYNKPIYGTEIDWYHRNGAFAMVMEFGFHQKKPSIKETKDEFNKTSEAVLFFIKNSINIDIKF